MKKIIAFLLFVFGAALVSIGKADDLANLSLNFCDTGAANVMNLALEPGTQTGICYTLINGGKNEVTVKVGFVDGTFTNDQRKNKACFTDEKTQMFGQYVTDYQQLVTLKAGEQLSQNALLKYPEGMNGLYHGCVVYSVVTPDKAAGGGTSFSIQMRRAKFIDVISGNPDELTNGNTIVLEEFSDADGDNLSSNPKIRIYKGLDDGYLIALKLKNVGVFDENLTITGVVSNLFGYKEVFTLPRVLTPGQSLLVTQKLTGKPNYNLSLALDISHFPTVFGGVESKGGSLQVFTGFIIWNIVTCLTLLGILIVTGVIILLVKDLKRKQTPAKKIKK